jgi:di/tricarboxylate transporter
MLWLFFGRTHRTHTNPVAEDHLMVMGPAGYKFGDYWKLGLPLMLWFFIVDVFLVPLIWPL